MKRRAPKKHRGTQRRRRKIIIWSVLVTLLIGCIVGFIFALSWLSRWDKIVIHDITISGNEVVGADEVKQVAEPFLDGAYWHIISKRNIFFYQKNDMKEAVENAFPWINTVAISVHNENLTIQIRERTPFALWCNETCYFTDEGGYIFTEAPTYSDNVFLVFNGGVTDEPIRSNLLDTNNFKVLNGFLAVLPRINMYPTTVDVDNPESIVVTMNNGMKLLFKEQSNYTSLATDIETILQDKVLSESKKQDFNNLDHLDMRFGDKVFYKLKEE